MLRLGFVSLLNDLAGEIVAPLVPIFLSSILGAPGVVVGIVEGAAEATHALLQGLAGRWSDLLARRRGLVILGYSISSIAKPLLGLATGWPLVLLARVADRFGKGMRTSPRDAMLADYSADGHRGKAFGIHRGLDNVGGTLGPLLGLLLLWLFHGDLRLVFFLSFIPGALAVILLFGIKDSAANGQNKARASLRELPPVFHRYLFVWACFAVANVSEVFFILRAKDLSQTTWLPVVLYSFFQFVFALTSTRAGILSDKVGRVGLLIGGMLLLTCAYLSFILSSSMAALWIGFGLYGLYKSATDGISRALAVDLAPASLRGTAIGLLGTVGGLSALAAGAIGGLLWSVGPWATFSYGIAGALAGAALLLWLRPSLPARKPAASAA